MKTVDEWNKDRAVDHAKLHAKWRVLPVKCPQCDSNIEYDTSMVYTSNPAQVDARCNALCGWKARILAP